MNTCKLWVGLLVIVLAVGALGCSGQAPQGWLPLWQDRWEWGSRGELWVRGVPANGPIEVDPGRGQILAAPISSISEPSTPATVVLRNTTISTWELGPGQVIPLHLEDLKNGARFEAPEGVVIANPRVGAEIDDAGVVVFIVIDTLRADHVNAELMPGVTGYFAGGRVWTQATANASWTLPSVASFFSSRPVLDLTAPSGDLIGIPAGVPTWSAELEAAGFTGAAVVANYSLSVLNGFGEGFSTFHVPDGKGTAEHPDAGWVVEAGRSWLDRHRGESAFLYLHLMDPHFPYRDHHDPAVIAPDLPALAAGLRPAAPGERELLEELYVGEVRYVDQVLTEFLNDLPNDAVVVLTSDHGESLGERDCWGHGLNLYQESLHVPLLIRGPGIAPGTVEEPVQHLDLAPTLLDLVGLPVPPLRWSGGHCLTEDRRGPSSPAPSAQDPCGGLGGSAMTRCCSGWRSNPGSAKLRGPRCSVGDGGNPAPSPSTSRTIHSRRIRIRCPDELVEPVTRSFVETAGRMVPGLQIALVHRGGPTSSRLKIDGTFEVVQAWSSAPMTVRLTEDELELSCENAYPICFLGVAVEPDSALVSTEDATHQLNMLRVPDSLTDGLSLWWNPDRPLIVGGYDETLERLRALGYIE